MYRRNKYNAKSCQYDGSIYHSRAEASYAQELDLRIKAKDIKSWKKQEKIDIRVNDIHVCNYYIDFVITHNDDTLEYVEVKGFSTAIWRLKWKLAMACYPDRKYTLVRV